MSVYLVKVETKATKALRVQWGQKEIKEAKVNEDLKEREAFKVNQAKMELRFEKL